MNEKAYVAVEFAFEIIFPSVNMRQFVRACGPKRNEARGARGETDIARYVSLRLSLFWAV